MNICCNSDMEMFSLSNGRLTSTTETIYSQVQRVFMKSKKGEERSMHLRINVELKSGITVATEKVLSVLITDDNDCTFYYSLLLTQDDFRVLKAQQGLLLDFSHFPSQLVKLLEVCRSQEVAKFILVLDEEESDSMHNCNLNGNPNSNNGVFFKVIETNNFKNLCHLSLKVVQGSDCEIKRHMSLKIANLTEKLSETENRCKKVESNLAEAMRALDEKTKELNQVQLKLAEERSNLRIETSHQISEEREKLNKMQLEWQSKLEFEKSQIEAQYQRVINDLNEQINLLTFNNKNLYEAKCQFELSVKEKNFQIETLEKQITQYTQELSLLRKQNSQLDQDYHEKEKALISLKTKMVVAEQEIKDKEKLLEKQQELWRVANEQKAFLEESLTEKEGQLQRKQIAIQNMSADLLKSNEIIAKLQTDLTANKAKMKLRTDIALEQERILEKKTQQIATQAEKIRQLEEKLDKVTKELNSVKLELENARKSIEEKEVVIKKNDNVINWLNRRLTESSNSSNSLPSARSGSDTMFAGLPKPGVMHLSKAWPPWLVNSVSGNASAIGTQKKDHGEAASCPTTSSTPLEPGTEQPRSRIPKTDENGQPETTNSELKNGPLDPKYFQACVDIVESSKSQILKAKNEKNSAPSSRASSKGRPPVSAYFPRKPVQLQSNQS